jgi:hypothetical protein
MVIAGRLRDRRGRHWWSRRNRRVSRSRSPRSQRGVYPREWRRSRRPACEATAPFQVTSDFGLSAAQLRWRLHNVVDQDVIEVGMIGSDVVEQPDQIKPVLEFKPALTFIAIGPDDREVMRLRVCRDHGSLISDRVSLAIGRHANILCRAIGRWRLRQSSFPDYLAHYPLSSSVGAGRAFLT